MVGSATEDGIPPVEATLDGVGSVTTGVAEDVGLTMDDGMTPVDATLEVTGSLSIGAAELEAGTTDDGMPPVGATISVPDGVGVTTGELVGSTGLGDVVVGSMGDSGTGSVEPTEGVEGSIALDEGEEVGVRMGPETPPVEPTLEVDDDTSLDTASADEVEVEVGRTGSEGTPCVEPTSSEVVIGDGETITVSTVSDDEGRRCSSDSKIFEISEDWSCDRSVLELGGKTRSDVGSGGVAGAVVFANCLLTCRGK